MNQRRPARGPLKTRAPIGARTPHIPTPPDGRKPPRGTIEIVGASKMAIMLARSRSAKLRVRVNATIALKMTRAYTSGT
jgi:hypothetical protein